MAANAFGHASAKLVFTTTSGKQVQVEEETLAMARSELKGACQVYSRMGGLDPYAGMADDERAYAHAILLAEAEELGISAPSEQVTALVDRFKQFVQQMAEQQQPGTVVYREDFARSLAQVRLTEQSLAA